MAVRCGGARPALGGAHDDHRPVGPWGLAAAAGLLLDRADAGDRLVHGRGHGAVHHHRLMALHQDRLPAVAAHQAGEFLRRDPRQDCWVGDLVAVQVQHRQNGTITAWIDEFIYVPGCCQWTGFSFPITNTGECNQFRVIKNCSAGMGEHITQFTAFMDRSGGFRGAVAADVSWEGELFEKSL